MAIRNERIRRTPLTDHDRSDRVVHTDNYADEEVVYTEDATAYKANSWISYVVGIVEALLALRVLFLLFGARDTGFAAMLYGITEPLVAPFRGIFAAPGVETGFFDTAAILAMVVYALLGWAIAALIDNTARTRRLA
jgi:uncharacterized protein YggT (Ycf19 family)